MNPFEELLSDDFRRTLNEGPFYTDYLYHVQETYPNIGLKSVPWGTEQTTDVPKLFAIKDVLIEHFNFVYKFREIGSETESRWQYTVDRVFDNVKRRYEFALGQYEDNDITVLGKKYIETIHREAESESNGEGSGEHTTTDTTEETAKNKFNDTPIQPLMESYDYASAITDNEVTTGRESSGSNSSTDHKESTVEEDITRTHTDLDEHILDLINESMDKFRDLIDDFVDEFSVCFINTLGRI